MSTESDINWVIGVEDATSAGIASVQKSFIGFSQMSKTSLGVVTDSLQGLASVARESSLSMRVALGMLADRLVGDYFDPIRDKLQEVTSFWRSSSEEQSQFIDLRKDHIAELRMGIHSLTDQMNLLRAAQQPDESLIADLKQQRAALDGQRLSLMLTTAAYSGLQAAQSGLNKLGNMFGGIWDGIGRMLQPVIDIVTSVFGPALEYLSAILSAELEPVTMAFFRLAQRIAPVLVMVMEPMAKGLIDIVRVLSSKLLGGPDAPLIKLMETFVDVLIKIVEGPLPILVNAFADILVVVIDLVDGALGTLAEVLLPIISNNMDLVVGVIEAVIIAMVAWKAITVGTALVVGGLNLVLGVLKGVMIAAQVATWLFNAALYANPIGLIVLAVVGLIAAVASLIIYWDDVVDAMKGAWTWMTTLLEPAFDVMSNAVSWLGEKIGAAIEWLWEMRGYLVYLVSPPLLIGRAMIWLAGVIWDQLGGAVNWIGRQFSALGDVISDFASFLWKGIRFVWDFFTDTLPNAIWSAVKWIGSMFVGLGEGIVAAFEWVGEALSSFGSSIYGVFEGIGDLFSDLVDWVSGIADQIGEAFSSIPDALENALDNTFNLFEDMWDGITDMFGGLGDWFVGLFDGAWSGVQRFLRSSFSGLMSFLGLDSAEDTIGGIFTSIVAGLHAPIEAMKELVNDYVIDTVNSILSFEIAGLSLKDDLGLGDIPYLAEGGVVGTRGPGTMAVIGEAGPEVILPLETRVLEKVIPAFNQGTPSDVTFPAKVRSALENGSASDKSQEQILRSIQNLLVQMLSRMDDDRGEAPMLPLEYA